MGYDIHSTASGILSDEMRVECRLNVGPRNVYLNLLLHFGNQRRKNDNEDDNNNTSQYQRHFHIFPRHLLSQIT